MHFLGECERRPAARLADLLMLAVVSCAAACGKTSAPSAPDVRGPYIGTWSGIVTSDVIGEGAATIVFDGGLKSPRADQVTGHWTFVFPDRTFTASGTVTGIQLPENAFFEMLFSAATVPCPSEKDGVSQKGRSASVTLMSDRMQGSYIANGCPGGMIDLRRK